MTQQVKAPQQQQVQLRLRQLSVEEAVALAYARRRALLKQGRTTRRITVPLKPYLIPPPSGRYISALGEVRIFSSFSVDQGKWFMTVVLPTTEGFQVKDFLPPQDKPSSQ
jgi:hypothetical protein